MRFLRILPQRPINQNMLLPRKRIPDQAEQVYGQRLYSESEWEPSYRVSVLLRKDVPIMLSVLGLEVRFQTTPPGI